MNITSNIRSNKWYCLTLFVAAVVFYLLTQFTVLKHDDILYGTVIGQNFKPIESLSDFLASVAQLRSTENGRFATVLSQVFMVLPSKVIFNICNTLVFVLLLHFSSRLANRREVMVPIVALMLVFILTRAPHPGETMLWLSGAIGYMWAATAGLAVIYFVEKVQSSRFKVQSAWWQLVLLFAGGIVAGSLNESVAMPVCFGLIVWFLANRQKPATASTLLLLGYFAGMLVILTAPSLWGRFGEEGVHAHGTVAQELVNRCLNMGKLSASYVTPTLALIAIAYSWVRNGFKRTFCRLDVWIFIGTFGLTFVLGDFKKQRLHFFFAVIAFVVTMRTFAELIPAKKWVRILTAVILLGCLALSYRAFGQVKRYYDFYQQVVSEIEHSGPDCVIDSKEWTLPKSRWVATNNFDSASFSSYLRTYAAIFGKRNIALVRDAVMKRYRQANMLEGSTPVVFHSSNPALVGDTIYTYAGEDFSIIPFDSARVDIHRLELKFNLNAEHNRNTEPDKFQSHILGHLNNSNSLSYYYLMHSGKCYLVVPAVEDDVDALAIPVRNGGSASEVTLTRHPVK